MPRRPRLALLSRRDHVVLRALAKARMMRTSDFLPVVFPSIAIARRRLRRLLDAGYVRCFVRALHENNRWVLDARGIDALPEDVAPPAAVPRELPATSDHREMLVRFWTRLVHACFTTRAADLVQFSFEWELAARDHVDTLTPHRPDAIFVLEADGEQLGFFLEIDAETESPSYVAAHKVGVFSRLHATETAIAGVAADALLIVAPTLRRLRAIARAAGEVHAPILVCVFDSGTPTVAIDTGWCRLQDILQEPPPEIGLLDGLELIEEEAVASRSRT